MASQGLGNAKNVLTTVASVAASAMLIRTILNDFLPEDLLNSYYSAITNLQRRLSPQFTIIIDEFRGFSRNQVFDAVETYLGTKVVSSAQRVKVGKAENEKYMAVAMDRDEEVTDVFDCFQVNWRLICSQTESSAPSHGHHLRDLNVSLRSQVRSYELKFHKRYKEKVITSYLPYVLATADAIEEKGKAIKLHTARYECWNSNIINLDHPMTFQTLAMDSNLKKTVLEDLDNFKRGKEFYKRIGKAWKRGYLLYGPPGTGKSSLIACIASYLNYDIYDLDLAEVDSNSVLRSLLLGMSSRSILVIEDIDCTIKLENRENEDADMYNRQKVTLSGLLNFIDGLWSSCGDERIFIFTTNHKERLDPALLRPGRMDMHIHMSYCTFSAFKQLAFNYLRVTDHQIFNKIEGLLRETKATPAEVAGELMKNYIDSTGSLQGFVEFLEKKKEDQGKFPRSAIINSKE